MSDFHESVADCDGVHDTVLCCWASAGVIFLARYFNPRSTPREKIYWNRYFGLAAQWYHLLSQNRTKL